MAWRHHLIALVGVALGLGGLLLALAGLERWLSFARIIPGGGWVSGRSG